MIGYVVPQLDARRAALALTGKLLGPGRVGPTVWRKILILRPDHLGDLLFLTPALRSLRNAFPTAEIVGLVGPWGRPVLERNSSLDRLLPWDFPWFDRKPKQSPLAPYRSLVGLARTLRREQFDVAIHFRSDFWWGAVATRLAGIPTRIGYDAPISRPFLTHSIPVRPQLHAANQNLTLVQAVVGEGQHAGLEFPLTDPERQRARTLLGQDGWTGRWLALQVGAGAAVKLWPLERLASVGRVLRDEFGLAVVVVGGPTEVEAVRFVCDQVGGALGLAGTTTLGELGAVLERCDVAIGPDSGPLHLAVAVGTPTVHLYGPADSRRFGPFGDPRWHRVVLTSRVCAPCNRLDFAGSELIVHDCVADIGTAAVLDAARDVLAQTSRHAGPR